MNPILQAINSGYSSEQVIEFISKAIPKLVPQINKAVSQGYGIKQILGFLAKSSPQDTRGLSQPQIQRRNRDADNQLAKNGLMAIGGGLGSYAARSALSRALPQSLAPIVQSPENATLTPNSVSATGNVNISPQTQTPTQTPVLNNQTISQQPPLDLSKANISQPTNIQQPKLFDTNIIKNGLAYRRQIDALIKSGNGPEEIEAYLKKFNPGFIKTIEKEGKGPFKDIVAQYMQEQLRDEAMQPEGSIPNAKTSPIQQEQPQLQKSEQLQEPIEQPKAEAESTKIEKNSIVSSPNGIGEVKEIRNGQAIIDVDSKLYKVKEEDIETSPIPEKDLADLYDDLIKGIESEIGEDVSRMVQWAGYNPETNTLQFLPHSGKLYKYGNISPEDAALLTDILSTRKTTGSNFIGAWKAGSKSPIGAALSKLIRKLQSERGGKGQEYEETHEPIYSAYEPAIEAKKRKKKKT